MARVNRGFDWLQPGPENDDTSVVPSQPRSVFCTIIGLIFVLVVEGKRHAVHTLYAASCSAAPALHREERRHGKRTNTVRYTTSNGRHAQHARHGNSLLACELAAQTQQTDLKLQAQRNTVLNLGQDPCKSQRLPPRACILSRPTKLPSCPCRRQPPHFPIFAFLLPCVLWCCVLFVLACLFHSSLPPS